MVPPAADPPDPDADARLAAEEADAATDEA